MSLGEKVRALVEDMMFRAQVTSASEGWVNHIYSTEGDPGLIAAIDIESAKNTKQTVEGDKTNTKNQDAHVKAYGKFMRESDPANQKGMPYVKEALEFLSNPSGTFFKMATNLFKDVAKIMPLVGPIIIAAFAVPEIAKRITKLVTSRVDIS